MTDIGTVVHYGRFDYPRDCEEVFHNCENLTSGVYLIQPDGSYDPFQVYCNNTIDGGSWTVSNLSNNYKDRYISKYFRIPLVIFAQRGDTGTGHWYKVIE